MPLNVVILAAGQGKRMHSDLPKVLHPLAGKPLIEHVVAAAKTLNPRRICVVAGHGGAQVREAVRDPGIRFVTQEPQLGTGHALQQALPALSDAPLTLVLYGDVPLIRTDTLRRLVPSGGETLRVLTAQLADPRGYGRVVRDRGGDIQSIVEERDASVEQRAIREINTGLMALPTGRLERWLAKLGNDNAQAEYYLTDVVALALADRVRVEGICIEDPFETLGVNSRAQLAQIERLYQHRYADALLDGGTSLADPDRIDVRGTLQCGRDVRIDVNCVFEGDVTLGAAVQIGPNCILRNVSIAADTRVEPFSFIEDAAIGERCRIGPYARIRPGTRLQADVHIGNFVEVKASDIGEGSKANHLAYIGDSSVGRDVNIGAGTITCNYDGANKHRTVIEDDVFIGSDTQLVAPVIVRKGATIGAGSTITREVAAQTLALSRVKQSAVAGWKRPTKKQRRQA
jgi:bifunctional UDP-N-acetylglucosamine pyrophosphorylase/glucosamine-1-phosphate N-acetyltransferase